MQKITPFLWFDNTLGEAIEFYTTVFKNSRIVSSVPGPDGNVFTATFEIEGQRFMGINGGSRFKFTEAISLFVSCENQAEVDDLWDKLSAEGEIQMCGWLKDKYGLSWQIIPKQLEQLLWAEDAAKARSVMDAMLQMKKIEVDKLQAAYENT
jgi:predicted 3-demethylubiquinone-9 3-methyltransferase (glyoxalase superfamily)